MLNLKSNFVRGQNVKLLTQCVLCTILFFTASFSHAETYTYDDTGRLTGVTYDDNTGISYSYDEAGNILQQTVGINSLPDSFALVYPADGATGLPTSIPLIWKKATDPDGDTVGYQVIYCDNVTFSGCSAQTVAINTQDMILYASLAGPFTGLFVLGLVFPGSPKSRVKKQLAFIAVLIFVSGLTACGGGGGDSSPDPDPNGLVLPTAAADEKSIDIGGLTAATTYFWKVTANDGKGGLTGSATRSFTTQ